MKHEKSTWLLSLLVFVLFALCLLLILLTGARAYRRTLRETELASDSRTKIQYLSTRIRQSQGAVSAQFDGCQALALREEIDGECYVTYIYVHQGFLRELFCAQGAALTADDGERLMAAQRLEISQEGPLLRIRLDQEEVCFCTEGRWSA